MIGFLCIEAWTMKQVLVEAQNMDHPDFRKGSITGALAHALAPLKENEVIKLEGCLNSFGQTVTIKRIRDKLIYIYMHHTDPRLDKVRFMTSRADDGAL